MNRYTQYVSSHLRKWFLPESSKTITDADLEDATINGYYNYFRYQLSKHDLEKMPSVLAQKENKVIHVEGSRETYERLETIHEGAYVFLIEGQIGFVSANLEDIPYMNREGNRLVVPVSLILPLIVAKYGTPKFARLVLSHVPKSALSFVIASAKATAMASDNIPTLRAIYEWPGNNDANYMCELSYIKNVVVLEWLIPRIRRDYLVDEYDTVLGAYIALDQLDLVNLMVTKGFSEITHHRVVMRAAQSRAINVFMYYMTKHSHNFSDTQTKEVLQMVTWIGGSCLEWCWDQYRDLIKECMSVLVDSSIEEFCFSSVIWLMKHGHILTPEQRAAVHNMLYGMEEPEPHMRKDVEEIDQRYAAQARV